MQTRCLMHVFISEGNVKAHLKSPSLLKLE